MCRKDADERQVPHRVQRVPEGGAGEGVHVQQVHHDTAQGRAVPCHRAVRETGEDLVPEPTGEGTQTEAEARRGRPDDAEHDGHGRRRHGPHGRAHQVGDVRHAHARARALLIDAAFSLLHAVRCFPLIGRRPVAFLVPRVNPSTDAPRRHVDDIGRDPAPIIATTVA